MEEAKYCEDIVPAIKASLEAAGFTNEHDRLGHFESRVPADTFFGLASQHSPIYLFGLQFKAPDEKIRWDLTHTRNQFDEIRLNWSKIIYYALPWYMDLTDSYRGLDLCAFINSTEFPELPSKIVRSKSTIPDEYLARLICSSYFHWAGIDSHDYSSFLQEIYYLIIRKGLKYFLERCINSKSQSREHIIIDKVKIPRDIRFNSRLFNNDHYGKMITDWNGKVSDTDKMIAKVLLKVNFAKDSTSFPFYGKIHVNELASMRLILSEKSKGFSNMKPLTEMLDFTGNANWTKWEDILALIKKGSFGINMIDLDLGRFKSQFENIFPSDNNALLIWYNHVKKIFYALETKRLVWKSHDNELGFIGDPLIAGLSPELRTNVAKFAQKLGITPSDLLERIVKIFLLNRDC